MSEHPRLFIAEEVRTELLGLPPRPWEIGGWLLGYWSENDEAIIVTHATPPAVRGTALGITISGEGHRHRFDEAWEKSEGQITFLGDWHSHPGGPARPSAQDARALRQLAEESPYGTPRPLAIIVQLPRFRWSSTVPELGFFLRDLDGTVRQLASTPTTYLLAVARAVPHWAWPKRVVSDEPATSCAVLPNTMRPNRLSGPRLVRRTPSCARSNGSRPSE